MFKRIDLTGKKFGELEIIEEISSAYSGADKNRKTLLKLKCKCKCGNIFFPYKTNVLRGKTKACLHCIGNGHFIGAKIDRLTVLRRDLTAVRSFVCLCQCGHESTIKSRYLASGHSPRQCERCRYPKKFSNRVIRPLREILAERARKKHDASRDSIVGKKFARLKVLKFLGMRFENGRNRPYYLTKCECGNLHELRGEQRNIIKSCGCLHKEKIPRGENQARALLKNIDVEAIREMMAAKAGYTQREIAKIFGVGEHVISHIAKGRSYASVGKKKGKPMDQDSD